MSIEARDTAVGGRICVDSYNLDFPGMAAVRLQLIDQYRAVMLTLTSDDVLWLIDQLRPVADLPSLPTQMKEWTVGTGR